MGLAFMQWVKQKYPGWKNIPEKWLFKMEDAWDARVPTITEKVVLEQVREIVKSVTKDVKIMDLIKTVAIINQVEVQKSKVWGALRKRAREVLK